MKSEEIKALFALFENASTEIEDIECWSARDLQKLFYRQLSPSHV